MRLSEQIAQTCCGVLADKQEMIDRARKLEESVDYHQRQLEKFKKQLMEIDSDK